jgi:[glutamine synthetase] adenylyltransferase / [glutamine synthetase]-adenylyl-L-tyrosine phosphorylase
MQNNIVEQALANLKQLTASSQTTLEPQLFQELTNNIKISRFVAEIYSEMAEPAAVQLQWHASHRSECFREYLTEILTECLFNSAPQRIENAECRFQDIKTDYQNEVNCMSFLRKIRRQHSAAIAVLELSELISVKQAMLRMSILAECLIQVAYVWSFAMQTQTFGIPQLVLESLDATSEKAIELALKSTESAGQVDSRFQNMMVLAMGKFGGMELNFSSDIDLIFFYLCSGQTSGGRRSIENNRFFQKVGQQLIRLLDEKTADGFVFRVDMRLRPYGDSGNLVMSVDQAEDYYHEQGRGWERFAMVRARIITGRAEEKFQLEQILRPFAFRRYIDYGVIDSLRSMKDMIQREVRRRGLVGNIKLGAGGIREIEFMVQSLQLIQGGRDKRLQERNLLKVLPLLAEQELLPKDSAQELADNYRFLRRLENCLQQLEERQTQHLPDSPEVQAVIAKLMRFQDWQSFKKSLDQIQQSTNKHFNALFGEERTMNEEQDDFYLSLWEGFITSQKLSEKLANISSEEATQLVSLLADFRDSNAHVSLSQKGAKRLKQFLPTLLAIGLETTNPVETIKNLIRILRTILKRTAYLDLLSENLPILQHLVDLVSRSQWVVDRLCESPILFDELLYPNSLYEPLQTSDLQSELRQSLLRIEESDKEQILDAIRNFKQINELRVAAALLAERLSISQVNRYLSQLAQVIIQTALAICWREMVQKYGEPAGLKDDSSIPNTQPTNLSQQVAADEIETGFAIIAYGKLGGNELGFNSDLDLVFLFDQPLDSETTGIVSLTDPNKKTGVLSTNRFYTRLAQKLIHFLSTRTSLGVLYEVDMRLRPSGNSGMLVSHIDTFKVYQQESAWTWEHQALVRARPVAGSKNISQHFSELRSHILGQERDSKTLAKDVVDMRQRMRKELDKSSEDWFNIKQGRGGLVDIEFISQFLVLNHIHNVNSETAAANAPDSTIDVLRFFRRQNLLSDNDCKQLIEAFSRYINRLNELTLESQKKLVPASEFIEQRANVIRIWKELFAKADADS